MQTHRDADEGDAISAGVGFPTSNGKSCDGCDEGWTCEAHPGTPWPHDDCAGPGMPCLEGCLDGWVEGPGWPNAVESGT